MKYFERTTNVALIKNVHFNFLTNYFVFVVDFMSHVMSICCAVE